MRHEYYDSILMLELSSMDLSSRKVVNMIQSSMNLQESILNWRFESYMFQEAHLLSHCISHWDISIKCTGNIINITRLLWFILLLWTGWISQLLCLAKVREQPVSMKSVEGSKNKWTTKKTRFIVSPQNSRSLTAVS